jgi:serine/threonine-protein kinase
MKKKGLPPLRTAVRTRPDPLKGRIALKRYRINAKLASGGMSTVYLARDIHDGGLFAVKILRGELIFEKGIRQRFINESRAAQRIDHPSVVKIYDVGEFDEVRICLAMEYVHGKSLRNLIQNGPLCLSDALRLLIAVAQGLEAAHRQGVIHRDLKPENVLLPQKADCETPAKLVDFGIARIVDTPHITTTQHIIGTPQYISPEQAMGAPVDHRADIYSLGVLMYEMLTGAPPFCDMQPEKLLQKHISDKPPRLCTHLDIPENLDALIMRCLEKAPWNRPSNMAEVLASLGEIGDLSKSKQ